MKRALQGQQTVEKGTLKLQTEELYSWTKLVNFLSPQVRLLRVLETGEFIKVGASKVKKTDVRIIAATNENVQKAIQRENLEDLFYRLSTVPIFLEPLREEK